MAEPTIPSRDELVAELRESGASAVRELRALPASVFEQGRYESGWNGKQILAHIASIEWTYPRLIDLAKQEATPAATDASKQQPEQAAEAVPRPGINDYNERQVSKRADASIEELIGEFERNRAQTVAAFAAVDESLLGAPIRSAGGISGTLSEVIRAVGIGHIAAHVRDISGTSTWTTDTATAGSDALQCIGNGTTTLHLQSGDEIGDILATNFVTSAGQVAATTQDATITCSGLPTPTPPPTATPTP